MAKGACLQLREQLDERRLVGAYLPRCTASGEFEVEQCYSSVDICWCVDDEGKEITNTRRNVLKEGRPKCNELSRFCLAPGGACAYCA